MAETVTWRELAAEQPEFVQWAVQRFGPVPEGPIDAGQLVDYLAEYLKEQGFDVL